MEAAPPPQACPVCGLEVPGDINRHLDECLNREVITQVQQEEERSVVVRGEEQEELLSPVISRKRSKRKAVLSSSSEEDSPVVQARKRHRVLASQGGARPLASQGEAREVSPAAAREPFREVDITDRSNTSDASDTPVEVVKKKAKSRSEFIEVEAEVSGPEMSGDEDEAGGDEYDQSFVDDQSQAGSEAMANPYLRSPVVAQRPLRPITADIFSQAVVAGEEDSYLEDSFCVASSQVDYSQDDTLDILDRRAERPPPPARARKRILVRPQEDTLRPQEDTQQPQSVSLLAPEARARPPAPDPTFLQPNLEDSLLQAERLSLVVSSGEVNRAAEVISLLKHRHGLFVVTRKCEEVQYVAGPQLAVCR